MKVVWTPEAQQDRADVWDYIAADNPQAAARLADYPKLGRAGVIPGTHELIPHENYRLVYEIERETVWVLALAHTGRQWPPVRE